MDKDKKEINVFLKILVLTFFFTQYNIPGIPFN